MLFEIHKQLHDKKTNILAIFNRSFSNSEIEGEEVVKIMTSQLVYDIMYGPLH